MPLPHHLNHWIKQISGFLFYFQHNLYCFFLNRKFKRFLDWWEFSYCMLYLADILVRFSVERQKVKLEGLIDLWLICDWFSRFYNSMSELCTSPDCLVDEDSIEDVVEVKDTVLKWSPFDKGAQSWKIHLYLALKKWTIKNKIEWLRVRRTSDNEENVLTKRW